jgi:NTE family protein
MSPLTLVNYSRCAAQNSSGTWPKAWITNAANSDWYDNPARVRRGRVAEAYALGRTVPSPEGKDFIHLLDGGIADNLGIAEPFRLLSTNEVSPNFFNQISQGKIRRIVFVLVNARSAKASKLNGEMATPGITAMLGATIDAAIDNATFGNFQRLETLLRERLRAAAAEMPEPLAGNFRNVETFFLPVDFDAIEDDGCRRAFQSIATRWTLPEKEIDALMIAGQALLKSAPQLSKVANSLGVSGIENLPDLEDACAVIEEARRKPDKS